MAAIFFSRPDTGIFGMVPPFEPVVRERADYDRLQPAQVPMSVTVAQPQDGIADELSGAVERSVPSAVAPEHLRAERAQVALPRPQVRCVLRRPSHREDRQVLQEQEGVGDRVRLAELPSCLQLPSLGVGHEARQAAHLDEDAGACFSSATAGF